MPRSSQKPLRKWEIPSLSILSAERMPALTGDSVTAGICSQSKTITVFITISKTGWLTFPISSYRHYGFSHTTWIALSRNSPISPIPSHHWNPFTLWISYKPVNNLHPTIQPPRTNGHLRIVSPFWKYRWHQQNHRVAGTQQTTFMDMVLLWALSMDRKEIGRRNAIPERLCQGFTCGTVKTQNQRSLTPTSHWGKMIRPMSHVLCMTRIANHHQTSSLCTRSTDRYDH